MIYTDGIHLITDSNIEELHEFASKIGLQRAWFQNKNKNHPHYDIWGTMLQRALKAGAQKIEPIKIVEILRKKSPLRIQKYEF